MCERRSKIIGKGNTKRLREGRRLHRLVVASPSASFPAAPSSAADKSAQCKLILELALKTISLLQKNNLIQQKIIALRKETSEFVASIMSNPENKRRYLHHLDMYGSTQFIQLQSQPLKLKSNMPLKLEPNV